MIRDLKPKQHANLHAVSIHSRSRTYRHEVLNAYYCDVTLTNPVVSLGEIGTERRMLTVPLDAIDTRGPRDGTELSRPRAGDGRDGEGDVNGQL